jgi:hypothetical protein
VYDLQIVRPTHALLNGLACRSKQSNSGRKRAKEN